MANILCITSGLNGILFASLALVKRLEAMGHELTYASPRAVGPQVEAQGIRYQQLPAICFNPEPEIPTKTGPLRKLSRLWYKWWNRDTRRKQALANLQPTDFLASIQHSAPALVIVDVEMHEYLITSIAKRIPTILLSQWFSLWQRPGLPPLVYDTLPVPGAKNRFTQAWQALRRQRRWMFAKQALRSAGTDRRSTLLRYAKQVGFSRQYIPDNFWPGPFTYHQLPVMSMTLAEMEFPHEPHPELTYVGTMINTKRPNLSASKDDQQRLKTILQQCTTQGLQLICCTVSSFKSGDDDFLRRVIAAVRTEKKWCLVIGLGSQLTVADLGNMPANVHAFKWLPQIQVLAQADCAINHGGIHTINECVHFGVPMLVYSGKRSDQDGCAARVHYHRLGMMADKDKDDSTAIASKLKQLLDDREVKDRLAQMQQHEQAYIDNQILEKLINSYLS